uniref:Uncharacterized protein n=1 Tax=Echeneis naucrates TaxID=173247 RepID=A0A665VAS8_ECHNA
LFSFQMCVKILEVAGKLNMDEYNFFLRGGLRDQMKNPCPSWLADSSWDNITELSELQNFTGLKYSFEQYHQDWKHWFTRAEPENTTLPGEWEDKCNWLQKMLIVRSLRQDRVSFFVTSCVVKNLGPRFVEPPALDMKESTSRTPLIFVLSSGVDPTGALLQLAEASSMRSQFYALSLGQGQIPIAKSMIEEGHWVFLANCHLSRSWMPDLDKLVKQLQVQEAHPNFRLWLSSSPFPGFPVNILQTGIKMTTEPPKGVKANMKRLYHLVTENQFTHCSKPIYYRKLLFSLCFFHSILLERKKFLQLGWNIVYGFNDSDFEVRSLLRLYLDEYKEIPWDALKYLIAGVNYGGNVTDDWDRRLLTTYILSCLSSYYIPRDGPQATYKEYISMLPSTEHPEVFGQHPNADIASQIAETKMLFEILLSLQPQVSSLSSIEPSREDKVRGRSFQRKEDKKTMLSICADTNVCLFFSSSLVELEKGIKGFVVMSPSLEETFLCIYDARVPSLWEKAYPSLKPLPAWTRDLCQRVDQFAHWADTAQPPNLFWLSGFTFPNGFLTAVLQTYAREHNVRFQITTFTNNIVKNKTRHKHTLYLFVKGLFLEGAGWNKNNSCLVEAEPMQMVSLFLSYLRFARVDMYLCPCYYYPVRSGGPGRASFVVGVELKSGVETSDHWIKRGTALLMSLDN